MKTGIVALTVTERLYFRGKQKKIGSTVMSDRTKQIEQIAGITILAHVD